MISLAYLLEREKVRGARKGSRRNFPFGMKFLIPSVGERGSKIIRIRKSTCVDMATREVSRLSSLYLD